jgi:glycosyltransferase involved in cell wall biosynthesis
MAPFSLPTKIGILVVAYNAAGTLANVLDRIPEGFRSRVTEVIICDDSSQDSTYLVGLGYKEISDLPLTVIRHERNLGYGGNQKSGYRIAIEHGIDVIVLLHGDGQYAPECIEALVKPLERGECDAVFGSRMMVPGDARRGGMPLYKYLGNKVLTCFQNGVLGTEFSEFHSGYRAYSVGALSSIPFEQNSDGFNFDTQIILQLLDAGKRIREVPIPTFYGDEICYVDGIRYAKDVASDVVQYRLRKMGLGGSSVVDLSEPALSERENSASRMITDLLSKFEPSRVLHLGSSDVATARRLFDQGHAVTTIADSFSPELRAALANAVQADLEKGIPEQVGTGYDVVVAPSVFGHLRVPEQILFDAHKVLAPSGTLVACVPNFAHWYVRMRVALGQFDYDRRGILDRDHLRFFTRRSFKRLAERTGWRAARIDPIGLPLDLLNPSRGKNRSLLGMADHMLASTRPTLFAYQFLVQLHRVTDDPPSDPSVIDARTDEERRALYQG